MGSRTVIDGVLTTLFALVLGVAIYIFALRGGGKGWWWWSSCGGDDDPRRHHHHHWQRHHHLRPPTSPPMIGVYGEEEEEEGYEPPPSLDAAAAAAMPPVTVPNGTMAGAGTETAVPPPPPPPPLLGLQDIIDFSDALVTPEQREELQTVAVDAEQIQTVNERFDAAKRKVTENRLRPGIHTNKERRKLVDNLLRRPYCSRRVRSWRTENSDTFRGDVIPKRTSSWGMLRAGRSNPEIDLHPGSMGLVSGLGGKWLSEEIIPDNAVNDPL
jgi:hypothetical protein